MARPKGKINVVCQNNKCSFYQKELGKDITKQGKNYAKHQRYLCKHCNIIFVETKGTPLYNLKLSERKIKQICISFSEGQGIRSIERTAHVHRDTICNLLDVLGKHAKQLSHHLVHDLSLSTYEVDELFVTIQKKRLGLSQKDINSLVEARKLLRHA
jgi:transposase-like protein